jgi:hypothetical protein
MDGWSGNKRCNVRNNPMTIIRLWLVGAVALVACRDSGHETPAPAPAPTEGSGSAVPQGSAYGNIIVTKDPVVAPDKKDAKKGDQQDNSWVPAEFKAGMAKWKDTCVYLDGQPIAFMNWGELPITLKPTWVESPMSINKPPHCPECPAFKMGKQRYYKFTDYLKALGVDVRKVKEMHVYGPKFTQSIIVKPKDFRDPLVEKFLFRFGTEVGGKALPQLEAGFANGKTPDKIASVMIYIDKTPPTMGADGFMLDGQVVNGVPYHGEPLRGGVRIYVDDRLATIIKRQELDAKKAKASPDGELQWNFGEFLAGKGVDTSKVVEGWVIRDERRKEKLAWTDLQKLSFAASSQASGGVLLGDTKIKANAIALHTRAIKPTELPVILPEEE